MGRLQNQVSGIREHRLFHLCGTPPQDKHDWPVLLIQNADCRVRKLFPANPSMGIRLVGTHGQNRIQKQHPLICPFCQAAVIRYITSAVVMELFINIHQRRRNLYIRLHRETKPMRLSVPMIRVLPQNHHFHILQRSKGKRIKNIIRRRENQPALILFINFLVKLLIIWFSKFRL